MIQLKPYLPQKTCSYCERPFILRKKWQRIWERVNYCSVCCGNEKCSQVGSHNES